MDMYADDTDFDLPVAAEFMDALLDLAEPPTLPNQDIGMYVKDLEIRMPVEMQLQSHSTERLHLRLSPPTQRTATSVFPVLHNIRLRMTVNKYG